MSYEDLPSIQQIIDHLESTSEDSWCVDVVRTNENKNCFFGHLFAMGKDERHSNFIWSCFEEAWATTYMIYPVNDGEHPDYQQPTPKQRVIEYLKNLRDGKEMTTYQSMEAGMIEYESKHLNNLNP
jgi:hypothetical protein